MPSALTTQLIAGPWTATVWNQGVAAQTAGDAVSIGQVEDGFTQIRTNSVEDLTSDLYGDTVLEGVYLGGNLFLEFTLQEINRVGALKLLYPGDATNDPDGDFGGDGDKLGTPGVLVTPTAMTLILTSTANTPSATELRGVSANDAGTNATAAVRTYGLVTLDNGHAVSQALQTRRTSVPVRLRCYPYDNGSGVNIWYTQTG